MNKEELVRKIRETRARVESLSREKDLETRIGQHSEWTLKSLLAHLTFWEHATLDVRSGKKTAESLKDVQTINSNLLEKSRTRKAEEVLQEFDSSGERLLKQIQDLSEAELHAPSPWDDGAPLLHHLEDDTCVHYEEHLRWMK